jgi:hypothetical protein
MHACTQQNSWRIDPVASATDGRASIANRDFGRELRVNYRKVIFSATTFLDSEIHRMELELGAAVTKKPRQSAESYRIAS